MGKIKYNQICPYCLRATSLLSTHKCSEMPENFSFDIVLNEAPFFHDLYQISDGLSSQGFLDIHKLHPVKYRKNFTHFYLDYLHDQNVDIKNTDSLVQLSKQAEKLLNNNDIEIVDLSQPKEKKTIKVKQVCPFCMDAVNSLSEHECSQLQEKKPNFSYNTSLLTNAFFVYLYRKFNAWTKNGLIKIRRLNQTLYSNEFWKIYDRLMQMEKPSLEIARTERFYQKKSPEESSQIESIIPSHTKKAIYHGISQVCPFCFRLLPNLKDHQCPQMKEKFEFGPKFETNQISAWFEELYKESGATSGKNPIDLHKLDRKKYYQLFFSNINTLSFPNSHDTASQLNSNLESMQYSLENLQKEMNFETNDHDLIDNLFGVNITQADPKKNILELLAAELEPNLTQKGKINNSLVNSQEKSGKLLETAEELMPLCFSCANMTNCPKGYDSAKMEHVFSCDKYIDMNSSESLEEKNDSSFQPESVCYICKLQTACPLEKSSEEMSVTYSCDLFVTQDSLGSEDFQDIDDPQSSSHQLRVFCTKCNHEMRKIVTTHNVFYRCFNYPECQVTADPFYVTQAVMKSVVSHVEHGDLLFLYRYDEDKNIVWITQIFSEGKLFL